MRNWYVVNTKPKKEGQVERLFQEGGFTVYCPRYLAESGIRPFFPSYAFLMFDYPSEYRTVKYTRGVKRIIVAEEEGTAIIPEEAIRSLRDRERDGLIVFEKYGEAPGVGDEIEVVEGPLKGLKGVFQREVGDRERVMILLNFVSYQGMLLIEKKKLKKI